MGGKGAQTDASTRESIQPSNAGARFGVLALSTLMAVSSLNAVAAHNYTIQHIPGLQDNFVVRISDAGHIVGSHYLWYQGTLTDLGGLGGNFTAVEDVNASGQIVGRSRDASGIMHAFVWQNGTMTPLPTLGGQDGYATAINNVGQVVGYTDDSPGPSILNHRATFWPNQTTAVDIGTIPPDHSSRAYAINNLSQVAGMSLPSTGSGFGADAFFWEAGVLTAFIQNKNPGEFAIGGMNDLGQVVGYSNSIAFVWQNGVMASLGTLGGTFSMGDSINNAGQIVGRSTLVPGGPVSAMLFEQGQMFDLNDLVPEMGDWLYLSVAYDINNSGQIVGIGKLRNSASTSEVFLLTPIYEPPVIAEASANPAILWPPNNRMVTVSLTAVVQADSEQATWSVFDVECNEPIGAKDVEFVDDHTVRLRAARSGSGIGRIYTLWLQAFDNFGNESEPMAVTVTVPHDQRKLRQVTVSKSASLLQRREQVLRVR